MALYDTVHTQVFGVDLNAKGVPDMPTAVSEAIYFAAPALALRGGGDFGFQRKALATSVSALESFQVWAALLREWRGKNPDPDELVEATYIVAKSLAPPHVHFNWDDIEGDATISEDCGTLTVTRRGEAFDIPLLPRSHPDIFPALAPEESDIYDVCRRPRAAWMRQSTHCHDIIPHAPSRIGIPHPVLPSILNSQ
eukprot:Polyplicarium_translucidae@DN1894_c2_g1_i2.p1